MIYILICLLAFIGYLLGSINSAVILSKVVYKNDIRTQGSGNAGLTNMNRVYGKKAALFTFIGDFFKGIIAALIGKLVMNLAGFDPMMGACVAGFFAVIGHNWPLYFGLKGGKGVLTSFSVILFVVPIPSLIILAIFVLIVAISKYVSLGSIVTSILLPVIVFLFGDYLGSEGGFTPIFFMCLFIGALVVMRHHANIVRLIKGEESKLSFKK